MRKRNKKEMTLETIKEKLKTINPNIEVLGEFKKETGKTKKRIKRFLHCRCKIDNYEWDGELSNLLNSGYGCPKCGLKTSKEKQSLTLNEVKIRLKEINPNIEILSNNYINAHTKLKIKCLICNNEWESTWSSLSTNKGCPECANESRATKMKYTIEEIKQKLKEINPNIEIISDIYLNNTTKLKCKCVVDGYIWEATWSNLCKDRGCPKCAIKNRSGENHCFWKGGVTPLHNFLRTHIESWKQNSFKYHNHKCDITGLHKNLIIHHLYGFDLILQETMETLNLPIHDKISKYTNDELKQITDLCLELHYKYGLGVCLCEEMHKEFHKIYGKGNNTKEQYEEFKKMKLKKLA